MNFCHSLLHTFIKYCWYIILPLTPDNDNFHEQKYIFKRRQKWISFSKCGRSYTFFRLQESVHIWKWTKTGRISTILWYNMKFNIIYYIYYIIFYESNDYLILMLRKMLKKDTNFVNHIFLIVIFVLIKLQWFSLRCSSLPFFAFWFLWLCLSTSEGNLFVVYWKVSNLFLTLIYEYIFAILFWFHSKWKSPHHKVVQNTTGEPVIKSGSINYVSGTPNSGIYTGLDHATHYHDLNGYYTALHQTNRSNWFG